MELSVREIDEKDISLIADYWLKSDDDFLINMGVDLNKLPSRSFFTNMLKKQLETPIKEKKSYAIIWELDGIPIGHTNVNDLVFGQQATMHLHLWQANNRQKGIGSTLVAKSLPFYFEKLQLNELFCEPYALNPAPNKTLQKLGFEMLKTYRTIPGGINYEQEVNRWVMTKEKYEDSILPFSTN
jgi:RimJ/RimL family protein N-acetyltransferase